MHNFPPPHPDELLYSTLARASVYHGITSPKQLLDAWIEIKMTSKSAWMVKVDGLIM